MPAQVEIIIAKDGTTRTTVHGAVGDSCKLLSAPYEALFGGVIATEATADAYEDPHEVEIKAEQGGK